MRILFYILTLIVCILPGRWITDYNVTNPVFWTVFGVWFLGNFVGLMEGMFYND